jgi:hypothetical protein
VAKDVELRFRATTGQLDKKLDGIAQRVDRVTGRFRNLETKATPGLQRLNRSIQKIAPTLATVGRTAQLVGAAIITMFVAGAKAATDYVARLYEVADAMGITFEKAEAVKRVVNSMSLDMQQFQSVASGVSGMLADAREGSETAANAFKRLGIDVNSAAVNSLDAVDLFGLVSEKLKAVKSSTERLAIARDLGISARAMRLLAGDWNAMVAAQANAVTALTEDQVEAVTALEGTMSQFANDLRGTMTKVIASAAPYIERFVKGLTEILEKVAAWVDKNPELAGQLATLAIKLGGFLVIAGTITTALAPTLMTLTKLQTLLGGVGGASNIASTGMKIAAKAGPTLAAGLGRLTTVLVGLGPQALVAAAALAAIYLVAKDIIEIRKGMEIAKRTRENWEKFGSVAAGEEAAGRVLPGTGRAWQGAEPPGYGTHLLAGIPLIGRGARRRIEAFEAEAARPKDIYRTSIVGQRARAREGVTAQDVMRDAHAMRATRDGDTYVNVNVVGGEMTERERRERAYRNAARRMVAQAEG